MLSEAEKITMRMLIEHLKEDISEAEAGIERDKRSIKLLEITFGI
jgi:hypothetical protein